jgi:Delta7-sterol 5-desaturase
MELSKLLVMLYTCQPMENSELLQFLALWADKYSGSAIRGITILGSMFLFFWAFKRPWLDKYRVQPPSDGHKAKPWREIFFTYTTYIVYAAGSAGVAWIYLKTGYTVMYMKVADYGWIYTIASFFIFMVWSDTTFYWSHVLMHKSKMLYKTHAYHHQFVNVTPWAAYAFHTGEALINAGFFMLSMLVIPFHPVAIFAYVIFSVSYNGMIHSGYDFFPKIWRQNYVLKWMNTPTHHIYHHQKSNCNYGFLFTFWDKVMKTEKLP